LQNGELQPNSITKVYIVFKPEDQKEDDDDPEKDLLREISFNFALKLSFDINYHPTFQIHGKILGPTFQLDRRHIDIDTMYLGENRYLDVAVINTGVIGGRVYFHKTPRYFWNYEFSLLFIYDILIQLHGRYHKSFIEKRVCRCERVKKL
jgi:hypothetical protein